MRDILKKAGALALAVSGLAFLMVQATLTNGCSASKPAPVAQAPVQQAGAEARAPEPEARAPEPEPPPYMGATKAPPMDFFRPRAPAAEAAPAQVPAKAESQQAP